jgi:hypothetical protein
LSSGLFLEHISNPNSKASAAKNSHQTPMSSRSALSRRNVTDTTDAYNLKDSYLSADSVSTRRPRPRHWVRGISDSPFENHQLREDERMKNMFRSVTSRCPALSCPVSLHPSLRLREKFLSEVFCIIWGQYPGIIDIIDKHQT